MANTFSICAHNYSSNLRSWLELIKDQINKPEFQLKLRPRVGIWHPSAFVLYRYQGQVYKTRNQWLSAHKKVLMRHDRFWNNRLLNNADGVPLVEELRRLSWVSGDYCYLTLTTSLRVVKFPKHQENLIFGGRVETARIVAMTLDSNRWDRPLRKRALTQWTTTHECSHSKERSLE